MPRTYQTWESYMEGRLKDSEHARLYLETALEEFHEDHDQSALMVAIRNVTNAQGGVAQLAQRTGLNRENLFRVLSGKSNPRWDTLEAILGGLGYRLSVTPIVEPAVA